MKIRRIAGIGCVAFGALNILNFWAPVPVPTVGPSAFIIGGLFIGLGIYLQLPRSASGRIEWRRLANIFLTGRRADGAAIDRTEPPRLIDPMLAVRVLRLASESKGSLTVAHAAISLNVSLDDAQAALDECVMKGAAYIEIDGETGIPEYRFPEFLPKE
ncbi:MAG: hypothetical protein KKA67_09550 [Spirochaetes bacterium]|nr:hypothetical protein [Spirochaetota bacterium]MBU1079889.1 hypothetical protein [Spirochaetota bacterium]